MKKIMMTLLAFAAALTVTGCTSNTGTDVEVTETPAISETPVVSETPAVEGAVSYVAGDYTAVVTGQNEMTVVVTFSETAIEAINIEHTETDGIGAPVVEAMPAQIIASQSLAIDVVSGATLTSQAILDAVADCVIQAGGDAEALRVVTE
ncbi:MAG: FMN-binding protein [Anaerorhabdus sp.]